MRALFTQFSLLIGILAGLEVQVRQPGVLVSIALGAVTACTIYIALLLGDYTIHKFLDEKAAAPASIRLLSSSEPSLDREHDNESALAPSSLDESAIKAA